MLTEECHLNPFLERNQIEVVDTDLGEWIVQLRNKPPSHILALSWPDAGWRDAHRATGQRPQ